MFGKIKVFELLFFVILWNLDIGKFNVLMLLWNIIKVVIGNLVV